MHGPAIIAALTQSDDVTVTLTGLRPGHILEDAERELIRLALSGNNGHRDKAAKWMGMGRRTLGMKLKLYRDRSMLC